MGIRPLPTRNWLTKACQTAFEKPSTRSRRSILQRGSHVHMGKPPRTHQKHNTPWYERTIRPEIGPCMSAERLRVSFADGIPTKVRRYSISSLNTRAVPNSRRGTFGQRTISLCGITAASCISRSMTMTMNPAAFTAYKWKGKFRNNRIYGARSQSIILLIAYSTMPRAPAVFSLGTIDRTTASSTIEFTSTHSSSASAETVGV